MDYSKETVNKLLSILLIKIELLPDNPFKDEEWQLTDSIYEWDGIDFISQNNFYLQIDFNGRVKMFNDSLRIVFESQI